MAQTRQQTTARLLKPREAPIPDVEVIPELSWLLLDISLATRRQRQKVRLLMLQ
jgi:hypothetical protein